MRFCLVILACYAMVARGQAGAAGSAGEAQEQRGGQVSERLVGAWHLVSVETVRPTGEVVYPFYGRHPEGLIVYDRSGWMSVEIVSDPQPTVPRTDSRQAFIDSPPAEKMAAVDGFYAYYGTWTVDSSGATVRHRIRQSLYPGERGEEVVRLLLIEGDKLTLVAKTHEMGEDRQRRLTWVRVGSMPH